MNWQTYLSQAGYRLSEPRKRVMSLMEATQKPLSPMDVHAELTRQQTGVGLVSVYRSLDLLTRLGLVTTIVLEDGTLGYIAAAHGHHHHILCQGCQRAIEFEGSEDLSGLIQRVEKDTRFKVSDHFLQLFGICPDCQSKEQHS